MARDVGLEELIREDLAAIAGLKEKAMFGGIAWLLNGHLLCAARDDGMLVRLGKGADGWALNAAGVSPMVNGGRPMTGWVRATERAFGDDSLRTRLIGARPAPEVVPLRGAPARSIPPQRLPQTAQSQLRGLFCRQRS